MPDVMAERAEIEREIAGRTICTALARTAAEHGTCPPTPTRSTVSMAPAASIPLRHRQSAGIIRRQPGRTPYVMGLKIDHRTVGGLTVVSLAGDIDVFESPRLREELQRLIDAGHQHLAVDLNAVRFLDSTGLGVLVGIFHRLRAVDGSIVLICTSDRIREVFRVTRLTDVFAIHPDLESVMRARQVE